MAVEFLSEVGAESRWPDATNRKCYLNGAEGTVQRSADELRNSRVLAYTRRVNKMCFSIIINFLKFTCASPNSRTDISKILNPC